MEGVLESPVHIPIRIPREDSFAEDQSESDVAPTPEPEPTSPRAVRTCNVGTFLDPEVPLVHCTRLLAHHFLLKGTPGATWQDSEVRVSVKALAVGCLSAVFSVYPQAINLTVDKSDPGLAKTKFKNKQVLIEIFISQKVKQCGTFFYLPTIPTLSSRA